MSKKSVKKPKPNKKSQMKPIFGKSDPPNLRKGTKIYYGGDMANEEGHGVITKTYKDQYGEFVDIKMDDGRDKRRVPKIIFSKEYKGHGGTKFVTDTAYKKYRKEQLKKLYEWSERTRKNSKTKKQNPSTKKKSSLKKKSKQTKLSSYNKPKTRSKKKSTRKKSKSKSKRKTSTKKRGRSNRQTGTSNKARDKKRTAQKPGKRKAQDGSIYYERRANRSDKNPKRRL